MDQVGWLRHEFHARQHAAHILHGEGMAARCEAELAILDEHRPSREDPKRCRVCTAITENGPVRYPTPCKTVRILAEGYRDRDGWEQYWGSGHA